MKSDISSLKDIAMLLWNDTTCDIKKRVSINYLYHLSSLLSAIVKSIASSFASNVRSITLSYDTEEDEFNTKTESSITQIRHNVPSVFPCFPISPFLIPHFITTSKQGYTTRNRDWKRITWAVRMAIHACCGSYACVRATLQVFFCCN